ncbi:F0F1 ATP synthase subunit delta [Blattabacterium cuenoti]|uniref:F0F1 ATP synthase subunit delta n=1 Tax=Blattabacterium cuenoti TaxID=1653831 RepID=UPI00163D16A7|nr:F0F1 ATP synthase subunit delta [Blattabacterium cuenoti]
MFPKNIIKHYAMILYEESIKNNNNTKNDFFYKKIKKASSILLYDNGKLKKIIQSLLLNDKKKIKIFKSIFYHFDSLLFRFVQLLILRKREYLLYDIFLEYKNIYKVKTKKLVECSITTVYPINIDILSKIAYKINPLKNKKYHIVNKINKSILGGFLFCIDNKKWDFSIKKQLSCIKEIFKN